MMEIIKKIDSLKFHTVIAIVLVQNIAMFSAIYFVGVYYIQTNHWLVISFMVCVAANMSPFYLVLIRAYWINQKDKTRFTTAFWKRLNRSKKGRRPFIIYAIYDVLGMQIGTFACVPDILFDYPLIAILIHLTSWTLFICGASIYFKKLLKIHEEMDNEGVLEAISH